MPHYFEDIESKPYTKFQCYTIESDKVLKMFVKMYQTEKLTVKDGRRKIFDLIYI